MKKLTISYCSTNNKKGQFIKECSKNHQMINHEFHVSSILYYRPHPNKGLIMKLLLGKPFDIF